MGASSPLHIAVLAGGFSGEADVSRRSAAMVMAHIDRDRFHPYLVHIDRDGWWTQEGDDQARRIVDRQTLGFVASDGKNLTADLAFVMVHGTPGEDGLLQAHLDLCGIPHTTASPRVMATTFHKGWTTALLRDAGLPVARSVECLLSETWDETRVKEIVAELGLPCFVKPNESGSSIGISRVEEANELWPAIEAARSTGTSTVLVEALLAGREFTCGVVPNGLGGLQALPVTEIVSHNAFFDYAAKYDGQSHEITPAEIDENATLALQETALAVYRTMHLKGMARVDMMMEEGAAPHVIEINAVPGFSARSIIPQQAAVVGIDKTSLISRVIDDALARV
ncbi:MAG: D-alanine--D-alanine ligase family protein [Flavobacteriales bacterium]